MKNLLPLLALALLFSCCSKTETVTTIVLPEFQVDGKKIDLPEGLLRTTALELIVSRPVYDQVKTESRFQDYESWKQGLRISPTRNTNLIEIEVDATDKKEVEKLVEALQKANSPSTFDGKSGNLKWIIMQPPGK